MALRGMPSYSADSGSCAIAMPPSPLIARRPSVPSLPVPESTMQMARSCWSWASERKKKSIGRRRPRGAAGSEQLQRAVHERHVLVGRDDVGAVGPHLHAVLDLVDLHAGEPLDQVEQQALVVGGEVLHEHERHAALAVGGHGGEERLEGRQAAGGGADADDREITAACLRRLPRSTRILALL